MNLIEQLGGYEESKKILYGYKNFGWKTQAVEMHFGFGFTIKDLDVALLEHRRQHNIFEIDDYIIHDGELKVFAMWSSAVEGCAYIGYAYAENGEMAHKDEFRHATDAEIKAGRRL